MTAVRDMQSMSLIGSIDRSGTSAQSPVCFKLQKSSHPFNKPKSTSEPNVRGLKFWAW
jgi:hypothetical protein